jgi:hypothetical protein
MKKLLLIILAFPALICAELRFPETYKSFAKGDYVRALDQYNAILVWNKEDLTDLERLEALWGRGISAMCIYEKDSHDSQRLLQKCVAEDEQKTMNMAVWFLGIFRD